MFVTTVTFLLFVRSFAAAIGSLAVSSFQAIMAGDIVLVSEAPWEFFDDPEERKAHQALHRQLPAQELRELLDRHSEENQGPVTGYHFVSHKLADALGYDVELWNSYKGQPVGLWSTTRATIPDQYQEYLHVTEMWTPDRSDSEGHPI